MIISFDFSKKKLYTRNRKRHSSLLKKKQKESLLLMFIIYLFSNDKMINTYFVMLKVEDEREDTEGSR